MKKSAQFQRGFTLIEAIVVIGLMAVLLTIAVLPLVRPQERASGGAATDILVSDLKQQQILSMMGDGGSQANAQPHGIRLEAQRYTLFTGSSFATSTDQLVVNLDQGITIAGVALPFDIIFTSRSGETTPVSGITISNIGGDQKSLTINGLGGINVN